LSTLESIKRRVHQSRVADVIISRPPPEQTPTKTQAKAKSLTTVSDDDCHSDTVVNEMDEVRNGVPEKFSG